MARDTTAPAQRLSAQANAAGDAREATLLAEHRAVLAEVLGGRVDALERVGGGRNSRVYRVRGAGGECAAKFYFGLTADGRNRLQVEYSAFDYLWRCGVRCVPRPLRSDAARQVALYEFIDGEPVAADAAGIADIDRLAAFIGELKALARRPESADLGTAAEAFFSVAGIVRNIRERYWRIAVLDAAGPSYDALREFLASEFVPAFARLEVWSRGRAGADAELPREHRTLSPSDLGFHNALRRADGSLVFLDFEYFGWDDPAKTLCDALLHPRMVLSDGLRARLAERFAAIFDADPGWRARLETVFPFFGLKWCIILLNEFRAEQLERRRFVDRDPEQAQTLQLRQLDAARRLLQWMAREQWRFPFWDREKQLSAIPKASAAGLDERSRHLRRQIVRVLDRGGRGHLGTSLSLVEILRVLFDGVLRYDPENPKWPERDRFILSKGHGCIALYVLLQEKGFFPEEELWKFCRFDGILGGHPDPKVPGVEFSTGSLGHGLPVGVGLALVAKRRNATHRVFAVLGDGECNEGSVWEAAMSASKHKLDNLIVMVDYNKQQSYGSTYEVLDLEPFAAKWEAFGFATREVDGHDVAALQRTLAVLPFQATRPSALICHTVKGKGISFAENNPKWHHKSSIKKNEIEELLVAIETAP